MIPGGSDVIGNQASDHGAGSIPTAPCYLLLGQPCPYGGVNVGKGSTHTFTGQLVAVYHAVYRFIAPSTAHSP